MFVFVDFKQLSYFNRSSREPLWTVADEIWAWTYGGETRFCFGKYGEKWEVEYEQSVSGV